jgi:hypothetical protein
MSSKLNLIELKRFHDEAHNINGGYIGDSLPEGVSLDIAEEIIAGGPHSTVRENERSVSVLAWITIDKDYELPDD